MISKFMARGGWACAASLVLFAAASVVHAQVLDLRTLDTAAAAWSGYDPATFQPQWVGDTQFISASSWWNPPSPPDSIPPGFGGGSGGGGDSGGSYGSDSTCIIGNPYTPWVPPAVPDIIKPQIFRQHVQSVEQTAASQSLTTATTAEAASVVAAFGQTTTDNAELSHYARLINWAGLTTTTIAQGQAIDHLTAAASQTSFTASGKVAASAAASAQSGSTILPPASSAAASSSLFTQATFDLKAVTQFNLSTALAQYGQMNLSVSISRAGQTQPLLSWTPQDGQLITQHTYGVLDAGRYTLTVQGDAQAGTNIVAPPVPVEPPAADPPATGDGTKLIGPIIISPPVSDPVSQTQSAAGQFDVQFDLHALEYWYYTTDAGGSGTRLLADSLVTVEAPVVQSGWVFVRGSVPTGTPADQWVYNDTPLPDDLLDTVVQQYVLNAGNSYPIGYLTYVDAYWNGDWQSIDLPMSQVFGETLDPTGWFDVATGQWISSPLDALQFDLPDAATEQQYVAQLQALTVPEPVAAALLLIAAAALPLRRRRPAA